MWRSLLVPAVIIAGLGLPAVAGAQVDPELAAQDAAEAEARELVADGALRCRATVGQVIAQRTPIERVTDQRPAGFDVRIRVREHGGLGDTETTWLLADGRLNPQNMAAARLAAGCRPANLTPATVLDWHRLTYLDPTSGEIDIRGSSAWAGAREVKALMRYSGLGLDLTDHSVPIWSRRCTAGAQTVRFTRTVFLLGEPEAFSVGIHDVSRGLRVRPFTRIAFVLNGRLIHAERRPGSGMVGALGPRGRELVRYGPNRLDIVVTKRATGSCNGAGSRRQVGLLVLLAGRHAWQLTGSRPPAQLQSSSETRIPYTIGNQGPSWLLEPVFVARGSFSIYPVAGPRLWVVGPTVSSSGGAENDGGCRRYERIGGQQVYATVCGLAPMAPRSERTLAVNMFGMADPIVDGPGTPFLSRWTAEWQFNGLRGSDPGSICRPPAGMKDCATLAP